MKDYDTFNLKVGQYIKTLRQNKNVSQEELGKAIKTKKSTIENWESGNIKNLKRSNIQKLADYFEINPVDFIFLEDTVINK